MKCSSVPVNVSDSDVWFESRAIMFMIRDWTAPCTPHPPPVPAHVGRAGVSAELERPCAERPCLRDGQNGRPCLRPPWPGPRANRLCDATPTARPPFPLSTTRRIPRQPRARERAKGARADGPCTACGAAEAGVAACQHAGERLPCWRAGAAQAGVAACRASSRSSSLLPQEAGAAACRAGKQGLGRPRPPPCLRSKTAVRAAAPQIRPRLERPAVRQVAWEQPTIAIRAATRLTTSRPGLALVAIARGEAI